LKSVEKAGAAVNVYLPVSDHDFPEPLVDGRQGLPRALVAAAKQFSQAGTWQIINMVESRT
jgi:hypothetical protein